MIYHLSIPQYLLESSFCLLAFYGFYHIALRKESYFQFNRFYLLGSALLSLCIPILNIDFTKASHLTGAKEIYPLLSSVDQFQTGIQQTITEDSSILHISLSDLITGLYIIGAFIMTLKLCSGLFKLFNIIARSPKLKDVDHTVLISEDIPASSFFSYIFWSDKHDKNDDVQNTIMEHELVHVRQHHSLDVILMEVMVIIKWFNPLIYLFRNSLKKTHEFIADQFVTNKMGDKIQYANILVTNSQSGSPSQYAHPFYGHLRERLEMLNRDKHGWGNRVKYLTIAPISIVLISLFSFDLSEKLPEPIKSSFQKVERQMVAAAETNVISLYQDPNRADNQFYLNWSNQMNLAITQRNIPQSFRFSYDIKDIDTLLNDNPSIIQNGKLAKTYIDTIHVIRNSERIDVNVKELDDPNLRQSFLEELKHDDIIKVDLKSFSDTDSLTLSLELIINKTNFTFFSSDKMRQKKLKWGNKEIPLNWVFSSTSLMFHEGMYIEPHEINELMKHKFEIQKEDSEDFNLIPEDYTISFKVRRANNSKLARISSEQINQLEDVSLYQNKIIYLTSYYHGKDYRVEEESKSFRLGKFYEFDKHFEEWFATLENGDVIELTISPPEGYKTEKYNITLRFKDNSEALNAPFPIELPHTANSNERFQIVMNDKGKSYVRIDTDDYRNDPITKAYANSESYEILHIPGFITKERVKTDLLPSGVLTIVPIDDIHLQNLNFLQLNDYYSESDELVRVDWGKMVSMPNIGNYSIKEFKRSSKQDMQLFVGTQKLEMERFDLVIIPENGTINRIRTDKINYPEVLKILSDVGPNTSIYLDRIILDVDGMRRYYPYNFVFTVE